MCTRMKRQPGSKTDVIYRHTVGRPAIQQDRVIILACLENEVFAATRYWACSSNAEKLLFRTDSFACSLAFPCCAMLSKKPG